ncbi:MAG: DMT family transporter [Pseudomonadota bacterium]
MIGKAGSTAVLGGLGLAVLYTVLISGADAITKVFAETYSAPQLFALSGLLVALLCVLVNRAPTRRPGGQWRGFSTKCPKTMAVRVIATILGTVAFYYAFALLPFAEVFLFIALIPLMAALASGPCLGETVGWRAWAALSLGSVGLACLFPAGIGTIGAGHFIAFAAAGLGTVSMIASRYIGRYDRNLLAQVFYPNLALGLVMALALPFVFTPMSVLHLLWAAGYAALLFAARWVLVAALRLLPAFVVTPLINLQFVWMVALGIIVFGERPGPEVYTGAGLMILAGAWLVRDRVRSCRSADRDAAKTGAAKPAILPAE